MPNRVLYDLQSMAQQNQGNSKILARFMCQKGASKIVPPLAVRFVRIRTVRPNTKKIEQHYTQKIALGFLPSFSLGNVPSKLLTFLKLSHKISLNLLSMCLAHYPMHSFINLKITFSLQSVFSPSPSLTLNPKAKIKSCLFQDQGS